MWRDADRLHKSQQHHTAPPAINLNLPSIPPVRHSAPLSLSPTNSVATDLCHRIVSGTLAELLDIDFGPPLHTVVLCGPHMHDIEQTMYERWHWNRQQRTAERQQQQKEQQDKQEAQWEQDRKERQAADDNRKRLLEQRKALERQKQQLETERRKTERLNAAIASYRDKDEGEEEDGVDVEPLL